MAPLSAGVGEPTRVGVLGLGGLGGSGRVAHDVALGLARRGHHVVMLTSAHGVFVSELAPEVEHQAVGAPTTPRPADAQWVGLLADELYAAVLRHELAVLSVHYGVGLAAAAIAARDRLAARGVGVRVVVTLHGTDVTHLTEDPVQRALLREAVMAADAVTAVSSSLSRAAAGRLQLSRAPRVVANGVDTDLFHPGESAAPDRPRVLCHASNFRAVKRPMDCIDVVASLNASRSPGEPVGLVMVGDGPLRPATEAYARSMGLGSAVVFIDPLPQPELAAHLRAADVALVTSESESFGLVALEAMASGTVLMGWRCEGLIDLLAADPELAQQVLAPLGDFTALTRRLQQLLGDDDDYAAVRARCLHIGRSQYHRAAQIDLYEALLNPASGVPGPWVIDART